MLASNKSSVVKFLQVYLNFRDRIVIYNKILTSAQSKFWCSESIFTESLFVSLLLVLGPNSKKTNE